MKRKLIAALENGDYAHDTNRGSIDTKNLLFTGDVSVDFVLSLAKACQGQDHSSAPHHFAPNLEVHILKREEWYIKFYFLEDPTVRFISVHRMLQ